ncbi:FUSC family protein [Facilibium subflavum]|uniref:hypothetical protein n=1 Tax=Facilibium subflavum TaxID=2219058 RepID=UPI000E65BD80|nr:hypothetical protein [Facilibium subflavum]
MSAWYHKFVSSKKQQNTYTLTQDPYLDIIYNAITTLLATMLLCGLYLVFQWSNFLILIVAGMFVVFVSDFPQSQMRYEKCLTATWIIGSLVISFLGVFFTIESRWLLLCWVFLYTLTCYSLTINNNNRRLHVVLGVVFLPIFIHLLYTSDLSQPLNSWLVLQDYLWGLFVCYTVAVFFALIMPRRFNAKAIIAALDFLYALRRVFQQLAHTGNYKADIYDMYRHIYFLRQHLPRLKKADKHFYALVEAYINIAHKLLLSLIYLINNHEGDKHLFVYYVKRLDHIINDEKESLLTDALMIDELSLIHQEVVNDIDRFLREIHPFYQQFIALRGRYA